MLTTLMAVLKSCIRDFIGGVVHPSCCCLTCADWDEKCKKCAFPPLPPVRNDVRAPGYLFFRPCYWYDAANLDCNCTMYIRGKSLNQSSTFWHNPFFIFLLGNFRTRSTDWALNETDNLVNLIILFHLAPSRMFYDKYFSSYDFLKIFILKILIEFLCISHDFMEDH